MVNRGFHIVFLFLFMPATVFPQDEIVATDTAVVVERRFMDEGEDGFQFDSITRQDLPFVRTVPEHIVDSLKAADDFWYANREKTKTKKSAQPAPGNRKSLFQAGWFRNLLWIIILGSFIGVVFWYLVSSNIFVFRKRAKKINNTENGEGETDDIFTLQYEREISVAVNAGNYRQAVRLWYLRTLKELAERNLISYQFGRTNQHYVAQLFKSPLYGQFSRLTRNFEYTWYGQFDLSAEAFQMMQTDFVNFQTSLRP